MHKKKQRKSKAAIVFYLLTSSSFENNKMAAVKSVWAEIQSRDWMMERVTRRTRAVETPLRMETRRPSMRAVYSTAASRVEGTRTAYCRTFFVGNEKE